MTDALRVKGLRKSYGKKEVLKGIDLCVRKGDWRKRPPNHIKSAIISI